MSTTRAGNPGRELVASHALPYEIWMMHWTADAITTGELQKALPMQNTVIGSFAIHARALVVFLEGRIPRQKDDVYAYDLTDPAYRAVFPKPLKDVLEKINKQIAHISESRTIDISYKFNGKDIADLRHKLDTEIETLKQNLLPIYGGIWDARGLLNPK